MYLYLQLDMLKAFSLEVQLESLSMQPGNVHDSKLIIVKDITLHDSKVTTVSSLVILKKIQFCMFLCTGRIMINLPG